MVINPVDKNAIEAALQLKERFGGKVVLVSMAPPDARETLIEGLAMGQPAHGSGCSQGDKHTSLHFADGSSSRPA